MLRTLNVWVHERYRANGLKHKPRSRAGWDTLKNRSKRPNLTTSLTRLLQSCAVPCHSLPLAAESDGGHVKAAKARLMPPSAVSCQFLSQVAGAWLELARPLTGHRISSRAIDRRKTKRGQEFGDSARAEVPTVSS